MTNKMADPYTKLISMAKLFVGVIEDRPNDGQLIRLFQEAVDGKAEGEPWCVAFCQYLIKQVDMEIYEDGFKGWPFSPLAKTESAIKLWDMSPTRCRRSTPQPGHIAVWRHWALIKSKNVLVATSMGHVGLVIHVNDDGTMDTIEGNTGPGPGIERNGDGVYVKKRKQRIDSGTMRTVGVLDPWPV